MKLIFIFLSLTFVSTQLLGQENQASKYFQQGYRAINAQNYDLAITHFEKAIELDSTGRCGTKYDGLAYSEMGYAYMRLEQHEAAMKFIDKSLELDSTNTNARQNKAVILNTQGLNEQAISELSKLISIKPGYINAYVQRGFIYKSEQKNEQAKMDFERALQINSIIKTLPKDLVKKLKSNIKEIEKGG